MHFKPYKMAEFSSMWSTGSAINMHSSNPEPFGWDELQTLTQLDFSALLSQTSFAYESTQGSIEVRKGLSQHVYQQTTANQIALTSGAQEGLFVLLHSLLSAGDQVVTFTPCFEPLVAIAQSLGAEVNALALHKTDNWALPWEQLTAAITPQTKLLIINFPHNPTGKQIEQTELDRLIALCEQAGCWLLSDEVFRGLEHDASKKLTAVADSYAQGISMGVMSKATALPGIRVGWLAMQNQALLQRCLEVKSHLSICQSSLDAHMCALLLPFSQAIHQRNTQIIVDNKNWLAAKLEQHPRYKFHATDAAATTFIELHDEDALKFCQNRVQQQGVFLMPNQAFLTAHPGFRLTLGKRQSHQLLDNIFTLD